MSLGDRGAPAQVIPHIGASGRGTPMGAPAAGAFQAGPIDAAAALPDDVLGSEPVHRHAGGPTGRGAGGRGMGPPLVSLPVFNLCTSDA